MTREGSLHGGLPFLAAGEGPPLVILAGLSPEHANPTGLERWWTMRVLRPLADRFTVYLVNRKPGLPPGATIGDLAGHYAAAIEDEFREPVLVEGVSTGGSIAQQLAIDHPGLVRRLVLADTACRLSPQGREAQRTLAAMVAAGRPRRGYAALGRVSASTAVGRRLMTGLMWATAGSMSPKDPSDMLITIAAEDAFDSSRDLHRITAPTLVIAGERDGFYSPALFRETTERIPAATLLLYRGKPHGVAVTRRAAVERIRRFLTS